MPFLKFLLLIFLLGQFVAYGQGLHLMRPKQSFFDNKKLVNDAKLLELVRSVRFYYVDSVNDKELVDKAITAFLQELDPHSYYIPREQSDEAMSELVGHFFGVGIEFAIQRDTLVVMSAIPNAPAERVGIRAGDKFLTVNGDPITNIKLTNLKVAKLLRGPKGTPVQLDVLRNKKVEKYTVIRDSIPVNSVDIAYMIRPTLGYLRVTRFAEPTVQEFLQALAKLKEQGATSYILDLRGNGGGLMQAAVLMASTFLQEGAMVVYAKGRRTGRQDFEAVNVAGTQYLKTPLVILVDENSASASEIVAGALQDWDRALIVGRRTYGKGLVQNQFAFPDSSLYRITVARYYTPSNRLIQTPYELGDKRAYIESFVRRYKNGELFHKDSVHFPDSLKYETLRNHRTVYGGGGIMPDLFIPLDTVMASKYVADLMRNGHIRQWVIDYVGEHRDALKKRYPTFQTYLDTFTLTEDEIRALIDYADKNGVKLKKEATLQQADYDELLWYAKVFFARSIFSFEYMHRVLHIRDEEVKCAVDLLENWSQKGKKLLEENH